MHDIIVDMLNTSIYTDCKGALDHGQRITGLYKVQPDDFEPFDVRSSFFIHITLHLLQVAGVL